MGPSKSIYIEIEYTQNVYYIHIKNTWCMTYTINDVYDKTQN